MFGLGIFSACVWVTALIICKSCCSCCIDESGIRLRVTNNCLQYGKLSTPQCSVCNSRFCFFFLFIRTSKFCRLFARITVLKLLATSASICFNLFSISCVRFLLKKKKQNNNNANASANCL